jgi:acyl-CoA synthetase (NDP forming)
MTRNLAPKSSTPDLKALFHPRATAVVGASGRPGQIGRIIFESLLRADRPVYPVHPTEKTILGRPVCRKVDDLPEEVDLAVVATAAAAVPAVSAACARRGIPYIVVVAGGFSETGPAGLALEKKLKEAIDGSGTRLLGPNTLGVFAPRERLDTIFVEHGDRALGQGGGVAFITQSGSLGVEALGIESNLGFGLRAFVGLGNRLDLDEVDFIRFFRADPQTTCLALYLESLADGRAFLEAAREASREKPVVALKAGRTPQGAAAASSHTGQLAGEDHLVTGAFRQYGLQRVYDEEQLCDAARVLSMVRPPDGNRVAIVSPAGGYSVMATDAVTDPLDPVPLAMARLSQPTEKVIRRLAPSFASARNPVDLTGNATDDMTMAALEAVLADPGVDILLSMTMFAPPGISDGIIRRIAGLATHTPKPIIVVSQFGPFTDGHIRRLYDHGVIGYPSVARGVRAVRWLVERAGIQARLAGKRPR